MELKSFVSNGQAMTLERAILLYTQGNNALATVCPVKHRADGPPLILPGVNLTRETLDGLVQRLTSTPIVREILPASVLCHDATVLAWWVPSGRRPIFFRTTNQKFDEEVNAQQVLHPALYFIARAGHLNVFALPDNARPTPETLVFRAPYFNLYGEGNMCPGNTRLPNSVQIVDIPTWERAFFDTQFTHSNVERSPLCLHPGGHNGLWREAMRLTDSDTFPVQHLLPLKITAQKVLSR